MWQDHIVSHAYFHQLRVPAGLIIAYNDNEMYCLHVCSYEQCRLQNYDTKLKELQVLKVLMKGLKLLKDGVSTSTFTIT